MTFEDLGLTPAISARLAESGLTEPTPIQLQAIPHALKGKDVLGLAQTGTGKTAAFGLPLIQALSGKRQAPKPGTTAALILAPTRELAGQIVNALRSFAGNAGNPRIQLVVGGKSIGAQSKAMSRGTDILVATPGRLIDLIDRKAVDLSATSFLVLDEADQMLDLGFIHALRRIATLLPKQRQTMLFSATLPKQMEEIAGSYLRDPARVEVSPPGKTADKIEQSVHFVPKPGKTPLLIDLLDEHRDELALVFARTKHGAERLKGQLEKAGYAAGSIHGNKSQGQRDRALAAFRQHKLRVLVATDVAARGIDIPGVGYVYNFDLPNVAESYVHRIGRTARAGAEGRAVAFCAEDEVSELRGIEKLIGTKIAVAGGTPWKGADAPVSEGGGKGRGGKPSGGPSGKSRNAPGRRPRRRRPTKQAAA
ncbi:DEAD/DEAH box helicase [Pseudoroseicyclus tamaricis]|uniref:DEAD/DEAH box helicase n=1 Tax=Pseudoroseicyclus tamaricis TaxID=2705421 RepID=A0A6B2K146_9RHOB|nr:DEAD/DEAH box helicase [Pseudoroseicyclus tamaricis]NDV02154.1 DEAD/DEAH box helicase [Pseudoroseicyclus tamaricis]